MQAIEYTAKTKKLALVQKPVPKISANDVLVKVAYSGVCGTDLHVIQGEFPCQQNASFSLGHEFSGTVIEAGSNVTHVKKGDRVVVNPNDGCNVCTPCTSGNPHFCKNGGIDKTIGIHRDGGWADYVSVPDVQVYKLPDNITLKQAALCEPLSCLAHGWDKIQPLTVGKRILVLGAGIIGNLWVCALHLQGHRRVTVSEPNEKRLELLRKLDTGYDCLTPDVLKKRQQELGDDFQFDLVIDCSGYAPAIEYSFTLLARGGTLCIFGVAHPDVKISIAPFQMFMKEATIMGIIINPFTFPKALGLLDAMGDRYLNYDLLGIRTYSLKEYEQALKDAKSGLVSKAIFKFTSD